MCIGLDWVFGGDSIGMVGSVRFGGSGRSSGGGNGLTAVSVVGLMVDAVAGWTAVVGV